MVRPSSSLRLLVPLLILRCGAGPAIAGPDQEVVPSDEAKDTAIIIATLEAFVKTEHPALRDAHAKGIGCVKGDFAVDANIPDKLRRGVFAAPRSYRTWIRFSNSAGIVQSDAKPDARGMSIKLIGVPGPKLSPEQGRADVQDFVMFSHPAFFIKDAAEYVPFLTMSLRGKQAQFFAEHPRDAAVFKATGEKAANLFDRPYYSAVPSTLGETYIKFAARPIDCATGATLAVAPGAPPKDQPNFLRRRMTEWLNAKPACFAFAVQPQTDPKTQPIEDPTVIWPVAEAPFVDVAKITIPKQGFDTKAQQTFCENLSFLPWHTVAAERPVGGINRVRKPVYQAISALRHKLNAAPDPEPSGTETFP